MELESNVCDQASVVGTPAEYTLKGSYVFTSQLAPNENIEVEWNHPDAISITRTIHRIRDEWETKKSYPYDALNPLEAICRTHPTCIEAYATMAKIRFYEREFLQAAHRAQDCIDIFESSEAARALKGKRIVSLHTRGLLDCYFFRAIAAWQMSPHHSTGNIASVSDLMPTFLGRWSYEELAGLALRDLLKLKTFDQRGHEQLDQSLAHLHLRLGNLHAAEQIMQAAPFHAPFAYDMTILELLRGNHVAAVQHGMRAIAANPLIFTFCTGKEEESDSFEVDDYRDRQSFDADWYYSNWIDIWWDGASRFTRPFPGGGTPWLFMRWLFKQEAVNRWLENRMEAPRRTKLPSVEVAEAVLRGARENG